MQLQINVVEKMDLYFAKPERGKCEDHAAFSHTASRKDLLWCESLDMVLVAQLDEVIKA
jgi:hypothetical protein